MQRVASMRSGSFMGHDVCRHDVCSAGLQTCITADLKVRTTADLKVRTTANLKVCTTVDIADSVEEAGGEKEKTARDRLPSTGAGEIEGLDAAGSCPANAARPQAVAMRGFCDVDEDLRKHPALVGGERPPDVHGIAQVGGLHPDDEDVEVRVVGERPPAAVRRLQPALERVHRQQCAGRASGTLDDAEVGRGSGSRGRAAAECGGECDRQQPRHLMVQSNTGRPLTCFVSSGIQSPMSKTCETTREPGFSCACSAGRSFRFTSAPMYSVTTVAGRKSVS